MQTVLHSPRTVDTRIDIALNPGGGAPPPKKPVSGISFTKLITGSALAGLVACLFVYYYWHVESVDTTSVLLKSIV